MKAFIEQAAESLERELDTARYLVVGNAFWKRSIFLYDRSHPDPVVLARMPGHPDTEAQCYDEQEGFRKFARLKVPSVVVPEVYGEMPYAGYRCFFQEVVRSRQWQVHIPIRGKYPRKQDFLQAAAYQIDIHNASRFVDEQGAVRCFQHGDFWIGNLGQLDRKLVLYDLEYAKPGGLPLYDLFHFCLYYCVALRNRGLVGSELAKGTYARTEEKRDFNVDRADVRTVFITPGPYRDLVEECIRQYCLNCGIAAPDAAALLKQYVECSIANKGIRGFPAGWEQQVTGNET